jgi:hypothetical protein
MPLLRWRGGGAVGDELAAGPLGTDQWGRWVTAVVLKVWAAPLLSALTCQCGRRH